MTNWTTKYRSKTILFGVANKSNNFTINLQDLWKLPVALDKRNIKIFTIPSVIDMAYYSLGYSIDYEDINQDGLFPIYRITYKSECLSNNITCIKEEKNNYNSVIKYSLPKDEYSFIYSGNYSTEGVSNFEVYLDGQLIKSSTSYSDTVYTGVVPIEKDKGNILELRFKSKGKIYGRYDSIFVQKKEKKINENIEINCFFVIGDEDE